MENFNPKEFSKTLRLVAGFINQTLSDRENDELDQWVNASDENQQVFEECLDIMGREVHGHEDISKQEIRFIAGLLMKQFSGKTNEEEKEALAEWSCLSSSNAEIYSKITHAEDARQLYFALKDLFMKNKGMLN